MDKYKYFSLETVYEAERKAFEDAVQSGIASTDYMLGICALLRHIEIQLEEAENDS